MRKKEKIYKKKSLCGNIRKKFQRQIDEKLDLTPNYVYLYMKILVYIHILYVCIAELTFFHINSVTKKVYIYIYMHMYMYI